MTLQYNNISQPTFQFQFQSFFLTTLPDGYGPLEGSLYAPRLDESCSTTDVGLPKAFGDYQYYWSFGGDQYFNLPAAIDNIFGTQGIWPQIIHVMSQPAFEAAGYTAMGNICVLIYVITSKLIFFSFLLRIRVEIRMYKDRQNLCFDLFHANN